MTKHSRGSTVDGPPPTPRWVKVFGLVLLVLVVAFVMVHLAGGGFRNHAP